MDVTGAVDLGDGTLTNSASLIIGGDLIRVSGSLLSTGIVTFDGVAAQAVAATGSTFADIRLANTGAANVDVSGNLALDNLTLDGGVLVMGTNTLTITGDVVRSAGGLDSSGTGRVVFAGPGAQSIDVTGSTF